MTSSFRMSCIVARWEFCRYFKLKDQLVGLIALLIGAGLGFGGVRLASSAGRVELAVIGTSSDFALPEDSRLTLATDACTEDECRQKVEDREIDGLLVVKATANPSAPDNKAAMNWTAQLIVRHEPTWLEEIRPLLQNERIKWKMQKQQVSADTLAQILAPVDIDVTTLADRDVSKVDRLIAYCLLGATLITSWIGLAYLMTGITGEKQMRVTEQVVSAIQPQVWIDGKLLGITAASVGSLAFLVIAGLVTLPAATLMGYPLQLPDAFQRWDFLPLFVFYYFGGVLFWNCFYAGVASIINDPNTSSRSSLLFLPMIPMIAAALVTSQPDGTLMRALSLLPGTSATAMPMRMVLGEVTGVEVLISMLLMVVGISLLRLLAGRIFAAGIMLYGKEPSWLDIANWTLGRTTNASSTH